MKITLGLLAFLLTFCIVGNSYAFETSAKAPEKVEILKHIGTKLQKHAAKFGCDEYAVGDFVDPKGNILAFEYVPKGDKVAAWTRMVTITSFALTGNPEKDKELQKGLIESQLAVYRTKTNVKQDLVGMTKTNEPVAFFEYEVGEGAAKEHAAAVFMRCCSQAAFLLQVQHRGKPLPESDIRKVKELILPEEQAKKITTTVIEAPKGLK